MSELGEMEEYSTEWSWSIKDFSSLPVTVNTKYKSPKFTFSNESWLLEIYPNGHKVYKSEGYISLFLSKVSSGLPMKIDFTLGLKTIDGKLEFEWSATHVYEKIGGYGFYCFLSRTQLFERKSDLLPSDTLTLVCRMKDSERTEVASSSKTVATKCSYCNEVLCAEEDVFFHLRKCKDLPIKCQKCDDEVALKNLYNHKCLVTETEGEECNSRSSTYSIQSKVIQDYKELFLKQKECDVILRVKEKEFPAHKSILAARSPVLESTFRNDMKEKQTGIVDIEDCDPSSFSSFLRFLYCGETETISDENVCSLFTTADKYDVQDLRDVCMKFIKENISVGTFCDTITLALQYCERELVTAATDFFIRNARTIVKTVQWQRFAVENPTQSNELIIKLLDVALVPNE